MTCPHCGNLKTHSHGAGRRRCPQCGKTWRPNPITKTGRPPLGDRPMTGYERLKRHIKKKKKIT